MGRRPSLYALPPVDETDLGIARSIAAENAAGPIWSSQDRDPMAAARANELSRRLGIPAELVEADLRNHAARDRQQTAQTHARENPAYARMMTNPRFAAAASADPSVPEVARRAATMLLGNAVRSGFSATPQGQASAATDRALQGRPGLARYRPFIEGTYRGYYSPTNPLRVAARVGRGALASAQEGAAGALGAVYDMATGRSFGYRTLQENVRDALRAGGEPVPEGELDPIRRYLDWVRTSARGDLEANRIQTGNEYVDAALQGVQSVPLQMAALVTAARGNPQAAVVMMAGMTGGASYGEAIDAGLNPTQALIYAATQGSLEAAGEALPIFSFLGDVARGSGLTRTLGRQFVSENLGEQFTTHSQDFAQWALIDANRGKTLADYWAERPRAARDTFIATTAAVGLQTPMARIIIRAAQRAGEAEQGQQEATVLDRLMDAAAGSQTRTANPSDFQEALAGVLQDTPNENIYIPAEQVRQLFQSPEDMRDDEFWRDYADQVNEAEALNGDVVIPLSAAATHLAGNPQWETLKDHARLSAGGMSRFEASDAETAFMDALQESGEQLAAEIEADRANREPVEKVYEAMRDKLLHAGFRLDVADQLATQFATRQRVRAERLGQPLTGTEADSVEVRQVLPEQLARAISAQNVPDAGLRSVIAAMRSKKSPRGDRARFGPSLIEFLVARGGIEDIGGELAHMGFGTIEKNARRTTRKGQRALIRRRSDNAPLDADGRPMQESAEHSFERALEAAIAAGYFPELTAQNLAEEEGESSLTAEALLEAIREEEAGRPRYADDKTSDADNLRMAAQELYALLDQQGIDPDKASDADIARTVSQYQAERSAGRGYDQSLFDDPDQPNRTMTQAQRAELEARQQQSKSRRPNQDTFGTAGPLFGQEEGQDSLFQSFGDGPRGRITFGNGKAVIDLFEARDLSTFIHETGHLYLEELKADAEIGRQMDTQEGQQLAADFDTVKAWFASEGHAVGEDGTIPTEAHEMWARGFERFAMEGKAPSTGLKRAFEAFRSWLLNIYKNVTSLRAPITPEIRDVMARLLATDEEILTAQVEQAIKLGFTSAKDAGMTDAEFGAYRKQAEEATSAAHDALLQRVMATVRAARTKAYREQKKEAEAEVAEQVDAQPVFRALAMLRAGAKLDKQFLLDSYGADALARMPSSVPPIYGDKNLVHPDVIAEEAGFASGDEMIRALMDHETARQEMRAAGDKRSPRQAAIDEGTAQVLAEQYGDPLRDGSIEEEARAIIHSDKQGEVFAAELRALARTSGKRPTPYRIARAWADERIAAGRVVDVASGSAIQRYARAAAKAGREFEQALAKGDRDAAFKHKQAQMLNNALVSASRDAKDRLDVAVRRLGKLAKAKTRASMDQDYLDQIHALLEQVEMRPRSQASLDEQQSYEAWADAQRNAGIDLVNEPSFAASLGKTHWSRLTVEQLVGLDETVQQIAHLGRLKQTLRDGLEKRQYEEARDELIASADGSGKGRKVSPLNDPSRKWWERAKSKIRWADASMIKIEQLADWLDGGKSNGPWNRMLFKPMADAQGAESDLMRRYTEAINGLIKAMPAKQAKDWNRLVDTPELINRVSPDPELHGQPWRFGKDQIVMIAMNLGNEGNRQRLLDGYGWSDSQVQAVLDRLMTKEDWDFVQGVWDALEELKAPLFEMERRVNGVEPDAVQATPVETPFGTYRGGYFPAVYDTAYSTAAELQDQEQTVGGGAFFKATTRSSATKERAAKVKRPMLLNVSVITRHLGEVIHDITHREAVIQVAKMLADQKLRNAIDRSLGPEYVKAMEGWLADIAKPGSSEARLWPVVRWVGKHLNRGISLAGLGYNVSSALIQPIGMANIVAQIGERATLEGQATFLAHPVRTYKEVTARSAEMRDRFSNMDANIAEMYAAHGGSKLRKIGPNAFVKHAYDGILYADMLITTGGWIGAFNKGLRDGMTEEDATYYADKVIRTSQGAGGAKDKSAIMRAPAFIRSLWPFFSYLNALYNQQRDVGRRARNVGSAADLLDVAKRAWWIMLVPPLLEALTRGDGPDEDNEESWAAYLAERVFIGNLGSLPGVGPIASAASTGYGYRASSLQRAGEGAVRGIDDTLALTGLSKDGDDDPSRSFIQNIFTTIGIFTGQPLAAPGKAAQFLYDTSTGEAEPESVADWYEGLTRGRLREEN